DLLDAGIVVDPKVTHVFPNGREIQESYGNSSARHLMNQLHADLRGHDRDPANFMLHHPFGGLARPPRIVVGVAEDDVVAEVHRAGLEAFNNFRKKWVLDIGNNNSERAAIT